MPRSKDDRFHGYISVWMPHELKAKIVQLAKIEDRSMSNMVVILLKRALKAPDVPQQ